MTAEQYKIIKFTCNDDSLQNLTVVKMAQRDWGVGKFMAGLSRLKVDADKIRPLNEELYKLITEYKE